MTGNFKKGEVWTQRQTYGEGRGGEDTQGEHDVKKIAEVGVTHL